MLGPLVDLTLPSWPIRVALAVPMRLVIFGGLREVVRGRFKIAWSRADERTYRLVRATIRTSWPYIPAALKWHYTECRGWLREAGTLPCQFWR